MHIRGQQALRYARQQIKAGRQDRAQRILTDILRTEPENWRAWFLLAACVQEIHKQRSFLENALAIRPDDTRIQRALDRLDSEQVRTPKRRQKTQKAGKRLMLNPGQLRWLFFLSILSLSIIAGLGFTVLNNPLPEARLPLGVDGPASDLSVARILDTPIPLATKALPLIPSSTRSNTQIPVRPTSTATYTAIPIDALLRASATPPGTDTPVPTLTPILHYWRTRIGASVEGRPIEVHRFGEGEVERMMIAGIHGGSEWNTTALANEVIAYIKEHSELIPANTSLFILPALNPDGEARAHGPDGRVNANGVDLNRNWDADWRAHWPRFGCWNLRPTNSGPYPASEPETQALMGFLLEHNVDVLINYHSAALGIFPSGSPPDPDSVRFAQEIAKISPYLYPPIRTGCVFSGTMVDWALAQGIIGVDLELRNHIDTDFEINLKVLSLLLDWQP